MSAIFRFLDNTSLKSLVSYSFIMAILSCIPLSVYLSQQTTSVRVGAADEKYETIVVDENASPYPKLPPVIQVIEKPFGKPGDSILIKGENFGEFQRESFVVIGGVVLSGIETPYWSDELIEAKIPENTKNGSVQVSVNGKNSIWGGKLSIVD